VNKTNILACCHLSLAIICGWLAYRWQVDLDPSLPIVPVGLASLALVCLVQCMRHVLDTIPYGWFDHEMQAFTQMMFASLCCVGIGAGLLWYALDNNLYIHPIALLWCACLIGCGLMLASITLFNFDRRS